MSGQPSLRTTSEASDPPPNADSVELMHWIDSLNRPMRALVHEFGVTIVAAMVEEGYTNAAELRDILEVWRDRRQEQWLATNYITKKTARQIVDHVMHRATMPRTA